MSSYQGQSSDADVDIGQLFAAVWREKIWILAGALIISALVFAAFTFVSPKYTAETKLLIDASESVFTRPSTENQTLDQRQGADRENVLSQVEVVTSSDLLLSVAQEVKLGEHTEFDSEADISALKMGMITLGLVDEPTAQSSEQRILSAIRDRLSVFAIENSRVIVIQFESSDPELAAKFPNELAKAYATIESRAQLKNTGEAAEYLASEIEQLEKGILDAEARVADFRASSGLLTGNNNEVLATQQLAQLSSELSRVRAERSSIEARVQSVERALQNGSSLDSLPDVINSPLIGRLREQQIQLNAQIADLSTTLLPGHPRIKALRSQLGDLSTQIRSQARNVLDSLRNQAATERNREAELIGDVNSLKAASSDANTNLVELRALERVAASQRGLLESYLIRFREARSRDETEYAPPNARVISTATVPTSASFPKMLPILTATFVGALLLMMLVTLLRELFSGRAIVPAKGQVPSSDQLVDTQIKAETVTASEPTSVAAARVRQKPSHAPATIPMAPAATPVPATPAANDKFSVAALSKRLIDRGARRAIVVSPEGDAGSICTVGLVRAMADQGLRAVLIDLTGTAASSQHMVADYSLPGITDLLASQANYSDVIHADAASYAHVIPTGNADPETAMRAAERLPIIMSALASAYDIVVADCGATSAAGLERLSTEGTEIIMAMVEPESGQAIRAAEDLIAGGYMDVLIMTGDEMLAPISPKSDQRFA